MPHLSRHPLLSQPLARRAGTVLGLVLALLVAGLPMAARAVGPLLAVDAETVIAVAVAAQPETAERPGAAGAPLLPADTDPGVALQAVDGGCGDPDAASARATGPGPCLARGPGRTGQPAARATPRRPLQARAQSPPIPG